MISKPSCSICQSENHSFYIETAAMMHVEKLEIYTFNRCHICESVFITNPVSENQLDQYYTNAYLPYRGEKAWGKYANFVVWDDQQLNARRVEMAMLYLHQKTEIDVLDIGCGKPDFWRNWQKMKIFGQWVLISPLHNGKSQNIKISHSLKVIGVTLNYIHSLISLRPGTILSMIMILIKPLKNVVNF